MLWVYVAHCISVLLLIMSSVQALEFFACHDINSKYKCKTATICNSEEICLVQKVYSTVQVAVGEPKTMLNYNMACKRREQCVNEYSLSTNSNVKSRYISACCCTDRCVEEDGTGYADYTHCFNALTEEEARRWMGGAAGRSPRHAIIIAIAALLIWMDGMY